MLPPAVSAAPLSSKAKAPRLKLLVGVNNSPSSVNADQPTLTAACPPLSGAPSPPVLRPPRVEVMTGGALLVWPEEFGHVEGKLAGVVVLIERSAKAGVPRATAPADRNRARNLNELIRFDMKTLRSFLKTMMAPPAEAPLFERQPRPNNQKW